MRWWLLFALTACRWHFDEVAPEEVPTPDGPTACVEGTACEPVAAVCYSGIQACGTTTCALDQPLDAVACPRGTCATGVCVGNAEEPFVYTPAGTNAYFGASVATDGTRIIVGATQANAAYIVEPEGTGWAVTATLTSASGPASSAFGAAVAIEGNLAVVGSRYSRGPGMPPVSGTGGAIVIYGREASGAWTELATVLGPDGGEFGNAVALSGGRILVGAEYANTIANGYGTAYIVEGSGTTWSVVKALAAESADRLGHFVQLTATRAFAGSLWDPGPNSSETGAIRVWEHGDGPNWNPIQTIQPDDPRVDAFGQGFSVDGDRIAVGVPWFYNPDRGTGAIYIYDRTASGTYETAGPIEMPVLQKDANFGRGIVVRGDRVVATSIDWNAGGAVSSNVYRLQSDGTWLLTATRVDAGGGDNGFAFGGIECDLQTTMIGDEAVVGFPIRGYNGGRAPGAVVFQNVAGL